MIMWAHNKSLYIKGTFVALFGVTAILFAASDHPLSAARKLATDGEVSSAKPKEEAKPTLSNNPLEDALGEVKEIKGETRTLTLGMGNSRVLEFPFDLGPIYITDPNLFDYRRIKEEGKPERKLQLVSKNSGTTDMMVHDAKGVPRLTYRVLVTREDVGLVVSQLEELLGDIEGLKIKPVGGTIYLDGEILLPKDMLRIIRVVDAMKDRDPKKKEIPIRNIASISKVTMNIIAERIEREIGSPEITARVLNNVILLEGTADSGPQADKAMEIAKTYLPEAFVEKSKGDAGEVRLKAQGGSGGGMPAIIDLLQVRPQSPQAPASSIKVTVNYVELNNEYEKIFNFEWKPLVSDNSTVKFDSNLGEVSANLVATVSSLFPKLIQAKNHGHARVLKQEQLIVKDRSDQPAAIESTIDFYARSLNEKGESNLQVIPVQNATRVKASIIPGTDSVELGIQITLNSVVGFNQGAPMVAKNSIQTQVVVKNGDAAALGGYGVDQSVSGFNREPTRQNASGVGQTVGGSTPIFNVNRSKQFRHDIQKYVIFVTPEILKTAGTGTEDITRKFRLGGGDR